VETSIGLLTDLVDKIIHDLIDVSISRTLSDETVVFHSLDDDTAL
jgi:hypothetical protein